MKTLFNRLTFLIIFLFLSITACGQHREWTEADKASMGTAPDAKTTPEAIVLVYTARTYHAYGILAVHSWIATKEKDSTDYTIYQVIGFRLKRTGSAISITHDLPDRRWYGAEPQLLRELKGKAAEIAIPKIKAAVADYPYPKFYRTWPGPNSNTFISHVIRKVPELGVELPPTAVGKDWLEDGHLVGISETNTGFIVSFWGALGFTAGLGDGVEVNLLGMTFGLDLWRPALKMPFVGRLGFRDAPVFDANQ